MADTDAGLVIGDDQMRALDGGGDKAVVPCQKPPVKVAIELDQPVACPGHRLHLKAVGTPSGGTYTWSVANGKLVDGSGKPKDKGESLYLRSFQPDAVNGRIPEAKAKVSVTYTHPDGTASDSKEVPVHSIDFDVAEGTVQRSDLRVERGMVDVHIQTPGEQATIDVNPTVKIRLGANCPRKAECAENHRVGWIQDITKWEKKLKYRKHLLEFLPREGPPIRDALSEAVEPFYSDEFQFKDDKDFYRVNLSDSPGFGGLLEDAKHPQPHMSPLERVIYKLDFSAWLVVQNIEWSGQDPDGSFVYLRNLDWSVDCTLEVSALHPRTFSPSIGPLNKGKGARTPSFTETAANQTAEARRTPPLPGAPQGR